MKHAKCASRDRASKDFVDVSGDAVESDVRRLHVSAQRAERAGEVIARQEHVSARR